MGRWKREKFTISHSKDDLDEKRINLRNRLYKLKPRRPVWWLVIMAIIIIGLYHYLSGIVGIK